MNLMQNRMNLIQNRMNMNNEEADLQIDLLKQINSSQSRTRINDAALELLRNPINAQQLGRAMRLPLAKPERILITKDNYRDVKAGDTVEIGGATGNFRVVNGQSTSLIGLVWVASTIRHSA